MASPFLAVYSTTLVLLTSLTAAAAMSMLTHGRIDFKLRNVITSYISLKGFAVIQPFSIL